MESGHGLGRLRLGGAFGVPVKILNDAAMQALGSDEGGRMLFVGLGSGLGTALVDDGRVVALELAHSSLSRIRRFEDVLGQRGLTALGEEAWRAAVLEGAELLRAAVAAEYVVLGGGNVRLFDRSAEGISPRQQRQGLRRRLSRVGSAGDRQRQRLAAEGAVGIRASRSISASSSRRIRRAPIDSSSRSAITCSSTIRRT